MEHPSELTMTAPATPPSSHPSPVETPSSRRNFIAGTAAAAAGAVAASLPIEACAQVAGSDRIKVGIVGTGGRGSKAVLQTLDANDAAQLVAAGDVFEERLLGRMPQRKAGGLDLILGELQKSGKAGKADLPAERQFVGFDAYQHVIESCDVVVLSTSRGSARSTSKRRSMLANTSSWKSRSARMRAVTTG